MKTSSFFALVVLLCVAYLAWCRAVTGGEPAGLIEIELHGVQSTVGVVNVALFNSPAGYYSDTKPFQGAYQVAASEIKNGIARVRFDAIPFGTYAIIAFHDVNRNGKLDRNFLGLPQEDYGFSNNVTALLSRPSFQRASFEVARTYQFKRIRMH